MSEQAWIEARQVSKRFGGVTALSDISVALTGPGVVGLIGPNGSGKSTLLGVLSGLIPPTEGEVFIDGGSMAHHSPYAFASAGLARTFQQVRLVPNLRVWENIAVGLKRGVKRAEQRERVAAIAGRLGVSDVLDAWPKDLPAGTQRRTQVATAVISDPRVVLLDEPAAGLTDQEAGELSSVIVDVARDALVVVVEHNMELVYSIAGRVVVLMDGELVADGEPATVATQPRVQDAYLGVS